MRHLKLLGLALMTVFAFGVVVAACASAEEKEPAGLLYLSGEEGPTLFKGSAVMSQQAKTLGLKSVTVTGSEVEFSGELGKGEGTHSTLGTVTITNKGVKLGKLACSSENAKGEKDAKEVVLFKAGNTDGHAVSLETIAGKLVPGLLGGLLEEEKHDETLNCGGAKVLILGAEFFEVQGASATADVNEVKVISTTALKCDKHDKLCAELLTKWGATATKKVGEKDEKVLCPLAIFLETEEECMELVAEKPVPVTLSKMGLVDF